MKRTIALLRAFLILVVVFTASPWQALAETAATPATTTTATTPAVSDPVAALLDADVYTASLKALIILFVLAILIESALAVIFNWRLFLQLFYGRGVKTLVMIAVSALVVWAFNVNTVDALMQAYGLPPPKTPHPWVGLGLTALILAGGSAGVYRILVALGYRQARTPEEVAQKPAKNKAWIAIRTIRKNAVGPIAVAIEDLGPPPEGSPPPLAGMIMDEGFWRRFAGVFLLDRTRFPPAGGEDVTPGRAYRIEVTGKDADGNTVAASINGIYSFTDGAIIDFTTTV